MKRKICVAMAAIMLLTTACGSGEVSGEDSVKQDEIVSEVPTEGAAEDVDEVVDLTVHGMFGEDVQDYSRIVLQEIQKQAGVTLTNTVANSATDESQSWTLMMSSPDTLPDIVTHSQLSTIEKFGMDGGLIPLQDLIAEHAPNIQKQFELHPELKVASTAADGNMYQVASMKAWTIANVPIIRQDWLDKLGLEIPTNINELHDVLYAFRNEDPNGNGEKDEVPIISRLSNTSGVNALLSLFGSTLGLIPRNGEIFYDPVTPEFKEAVSELSKWYEEGLMDKEIFTRGPDSRNLFLSENKGGFTMDWTASTTQYNDILKESVPGFNMAVIPPVENLRGDQIAYHKTIPYAGPAITVGSDKPVEAIKFIDFMYSPEGIMLDAFGIEGVTYEYDEEGKLKFTELITNNPDGTTQGRIDNGMMARLGCVDPVELEYVIATNDAAIEGYDLYSENADTWYVDDEYIGYQFKYTTEEQQEIALLIADLEAYVTETTISWILGNGSVESDYDNFINEIKLRGVDRVLEIAQTAYDRVK
ncbi:MAG: extracellular solute-binding protein [Lachnospirales bacterium]